MTHILGTVIIVLGIVNVLRMSALFILGDIADAFRHARRPLKIKKGPSPTINIIVAAYNEAKAIERTLTSIYASTYRKFRVIIVDDGSTDGTGAMVKAFKKKHKLKNLLLISQSNQGKAHALNNALRTMVKNSLVMTLDADSVLDARALEKVIPYFSDPQTVAVASNVRIMKSPTLLSHIQYIEYLLGHRLKKAYTLLNNEYIIGGIGSTFRRTILKKVRYYDTDTITEDIDLTMKIVSLGNKKHRVVFAEDVVCFTESVMSFPELFRQRFRWKYGRMQTLWKNKKLFFNFSERYTKLLTFLQLPFVLFSEFTFLFDPIFIGYIVYLSVINRDAASFQGMFIFLWFYVFVTVIADEFTTLREKVELLVISPLAYIFFFVISLVEYPALVKCIIQFEGIVRAREINRCDWSHVERDGSAILR